MTKITFNATATRALDIMENTSQHVFLTGKAGTGKSTLLEHFRLHTKKKCAVLAPTGVAAINVNGETIHAFFGLKPGFELEEVTHKPVKPRNPKIYQKLETIVIDEISMVRADILDAVNIYLQKVRENDAPFGGVQMIFIGDLYQLPPVVTNHERQSFALKYQHSFFFASDILNNKNFEMELIELDEIYRQKDDHFINILNAVRNNSVENEHIDLLNKRVQPNFTKDKKYIYLMTTNADANKVNEAKLKELKTEELHFRANTMGSIKQNQYPTEENLYLKIGSQVMFVNNDQNRDWVNGTIGKIVDFDDDEEILTVEKNDGSTIEVRAHTWEISKYVLKGNKFEREMIGSFTQFPLKLAWAITIHKSQGKTFDKVIINLGRGSFAHGQTYVAFSRCTSLNGIILSRPVRKSDIKLDYNVQKFLTTYQYKISEKEFPLDTKISLIEESIEKKSKIKIIYLNAKNEKYIKEIIPHNVGKMNFRGHEYIAMEALCLEKQAKRLFNVARIINIETT